ncbi:MAG: DUF5693 family protein [Candidatus Margulisbacteria bacterium]|nr:DUF5693 family protein [Candidatus Margulisiibacteriota bacterium]
MAVSLGVFGYRLFLEQLNMTVELAYDQGDVLSLQAYTGQTQAQILKMLQRAGVTSIVVPEDTLNNLTARGLATWVTGQDLLNMARFGQIQNPVLLALIRSTDIMPESNYIMIEQVAAFQRAQNSLINDLGPERARVAGRNIIEIRGQVDNLGNIGLGIDEQVVETLKIYKFQIIPKLADSRRIDAVSLGLKIDALCALTDARTLIFSGGEILGYGGNLALVAEKMQKNNVNFGMIEFLNQKGSRALAEYLPGHNIGVHTVTSAQLQRMTKERAADRYLLATLDRGMRILYLRAFTNEKLADDLLAYNENFISTLKNRLERRGTTVLPVDKVSLGLDPALAVISGIFISLGLVPVFYFFLQLFFKNLPENIFWWGLILTLLLDAVFWRLNYFSQWRSLLALAVAIVFPTIAMLTQLPKTDDWPADKITMRETLFGILRIVGITMLGALLIIALLSDSYHMLKIYQFRGVKLAFGLPLLIVAFYYFMYPYRIKSLRFIFKRFLQSKVTIGYVLAGGCALVFLAFYFLRSGNYQLPVFAGEAAMRNFLSYTMLVRPRTKEFLIGYPLLVFIFHNLGAAIDYRYKWLFFTLATIAPISLLNTFCHLHAPLWVSLLRSINGLLLGVLIGYLLNWSYKTAEKVWRYIF